MTKTSQADVSPADANARVQDLDILVGGIQLVGSVRCQPRRNAVYFSVVGRCRLMSL